MRNFRGLPSSVAVPAILLGAFVGCSPDAGAPAHGLLGTEGRIAQIGAPVGDVHPYLGAQRITVLLVRSNTTNEFTDSTFSLAATEVLAEMRKVMGANSAGRLQLSFRVVGPLQVSQDVCDVDEVDNSVTQRGVFEAAVHASDPMLDWSTVRQVMVLYQGHGCRTGDSGADRRLWGIHTDEGEVDASVTFVTDIITARSMPSFTPIHELAHTIGAAHNHSWICTQEGRRVMVDHSPFAEHNANCALAGFGFAGIDQMGFATHHFGAPHKIRWGWISPAEVQTVTAGSFIIHATEGPHDPSRRKVLRVLVPSETYHSFLLEYRSAKVPLVPHATGWQQQVGVYLWADRSSANASSADVLEPFDGAQSETEFEARALPVGVPITDPATGMTFRVEYLDGPRAKVTIWRTP